MKYALKTNIHNGKLVGVPVAAAAEKVPPQIVALLKCHGLEPQTYTVAQVDKHFKERGTSLEARFACKSALNQIGALQ
jgi:hypothetical protein